MVRAKAADKQDDAPQQPRTVSIEEFITTRDRVVNGLSNLQFAIASLLNAYLDHCKVLVGDAGVNPTAFNPSASGPADAAFATKTDKKKKVKKERDPDAPKRPLTAAFLYSQHARPVVKHDLEQELKAGDKLAPNAVNEEVNRRWNSLDDDSKQQWKDQYKKNLEQYKIEAAEYEATKKAKADQDMADAEDVEDVVPGAAQVESDADGSSDEETSVREPSSPPKAPTPPPASASKANKRRKTTKENGVAVSSGTEVPLPGLSSTRASAVPLPGSSANTSEKPAGKKAPAKKAKAESPVATKSRARKSKAADEEPSVVEPEPEKKTTKRKRKGDA